MRQIRRATRTDVPALSMLIDRSVRELHRGDYTPAQIELGLANVYGVDSAIIDDGTYFVVEEDAAIVACGGWSKRATLCGGDHYRERSEKLLDPRHDAAILRAFYVSPSHARRGLAMLLLHVCEREAALAGFARVELSSTLTGVALYAAAGYAATGASDVSLPDGTALPAVHMHRTLPQPAAAFPGGAEGGRAGTGDLQRIETPLP